MQFQIAFLSAILLTGIVYLLVAAGLFKNNIKQLYSRRTKREKFLTIGVVILAVVMMLFVAGRLGKPVVIGEYTSTVNNALLWLLGGSVDILTMAAYLVCALPVIIISAGILDELAQRNNLLEIPYFFYVLLFVVEGLFYETTKTPITGWFVLMLLATLAYCKIKMNYEGSNRTKSLLSALMIVGIVGICVLEKTVPTLLIVRYLVVMVLNVLLSVVLNRTSVLKKKVWLVVIIVCYGVAFLLGRLI